MEGQSRSAPRFFRCEVVDLTWEYRPAPESAEGQFRDVRLDLRGRLPIAPVVQSFLHLFGFWNGWTNCF